MEESVYVHPTAIVGPSEVGPGTRIWAFAHVLEGARVGANCNICDHCFVEGGAEIGDGVVLKNGVSVWDGVTIERYVFVGPNTVFTNERHPRSSRSPFTRYPPGDRGWLAHTRICEGATLGANATVICGLTIGRYALVAAGAVVTRDVPDYTIVAGSPAQPKGFACKCGTTLPAGPTPQCPACGLCYRADGDALRALDEDDPPVS